MMAPTVAVVVALVAEKETPYLDWFVGLVQHCPALPTLIVCRTCLVVVEVLVTMSATATTKIFVRAMPCATRAFVWDPSVSRTMNNACCARFFAMGPRAYLVGRIAPLLGGLG